MDGDQNFFARSWSEDDFAPARGNGLRDSARGEDLQRVLSSVTVSLSVELATLELSVADLLCLSSGVILDLAIPAGCEVTLRLHDEALAKARLVLVGDDVAIEITEITKTLNGEQGEDENRVEEPGR